MSGQGIFTEDFQCGLGDFLEVGDQDDAPAPQPGNPNPNPGNPNQENPNDVKDPKLRKDPFPPLDCAMSASDLVGKYKKALLNRQQVWKDLHAKWLAAKPATGQLLAQNFCNVFCCREYGVFFGGHVVIFFPAVFHFPSRSEWDALEGTCKNLADLYKGLCGIEQEQSSINPANKTPYAEIFQKIKSSCVQFNNESSMVKVHLPRAPPKARKAKPVPGTPKDEDPGDEEE